MTTLLEHDSVFLSFFSSLLFEELNMCSAVGQLKVCVPCFKVIIFCVAKGKYSKPQKITHLLGFMERGEDAAMCGCALNSAHLGKGIYTKQWRKRALKRRCNVNTMEA